MYKYHQGHEPAVTVASMLINLAATHPCIALPEQHIKATEADWFCIL